MICQKFVTPYVGLLNTLFYFVIQIFFMELINNPSDFFSPTNKKEKNNNYHMTIGKLFSNIILKSTQNPPNM